MIRRKSVASPRKIRDATVVDVIVIVIVDVIVIGHVIVAVRVNVNVTVEVIDAVVADSWLTSTVPYADSVVI